jgi:hypothetical protein
MSIKKILITLTSIAMMTGLATAHAWTIDMNFNNGTIGNKVEDYGSGHYAFTDAAGNTVYDQCAGFAQDGQCAKMSINAGDTGFGSWGGRITFSNLGLPNLVPGDEVWYSVKVYMPVGFDYSSNPHLKFMRLHTASPGRSNEGYNDLYITPDGPNHWDGSKNSDDPYFFIKEQQDVMMLFGNYNTDRPQRGVWETYEVYLKMDYVSASNGGTSRVRVWKNGKLLADLPNIQTLNSAQSYANQFLLFTYWNGGAPKTESLYVDDLIITTDTPSKRDINGFPMIGDIVASPNAPSNFKVN